jgi:hypothetical protein
MSPIAPTHFLRSVPWRSLRLPFAIAGLALAAAGLVVWLTGAAVTDATRRLEQARTANKRAVAELDAGRELDARLRPALDRFRELETRGVVGPGPRAQWQEIVTRSLTTRRTPDGSKSTVERARFSPARALAIKSTPGAEPPGDPESRLRVIASTLQLHAEVRHEGELLTLLERLDAERSAVVLTRACSLDRLPRGAIGGNEPTLRASCAIDWLTMDPGMVEHAR